MRPEGLLRPAQSVEGVAHPPTLVEVLRDHVIILPEDSTKPNRINMYLLQESDCGEILKLTATWPGGYRTTGGNAIGFRNCIDGDEKLTRTIVVPFQGDTPEMHMTPVFTDQHWSACTSRWNVLAYDKWPERPDTPLDAYDEMVMTRLRNAGADPWARCVYARINNFNWYRDERQLRHFLVPSREGDLVSLQAWMGAPNADPSSGYAAGVATFGVDGCRGAPDFYKPQRM